MAAMEKNNKNLNVPNLRFPEFSGEWEKGTLQSVATLSKGTGISKDQLSEDGQPCILYGELYTKYKSEIIDVIISKTDIDSQKLVRSQTNDVIIPCSGESAVDIATARCVKQSDVLLGGDLNIIRLKGEHDGSFFAYQLNGKRKYDIAKVAQGVSVVHLYGEHLKGVKVDYPSAAEQKKISSLLALIDQRIETQKKIIEDLKKLKDAITHSHYRNELSHSPMVYIGQYITQVSKRNKDAKIDRVLSVSKKYGFINQDEQFEDREVASADTSNYKVVHKGDFAYNPARINVGSVARLQEFENGIVSPMYVCFTAKKGLLPAYFELYLSTSIFKHEMNKRLEGSVRLCLTYESLCNIKIALPEFNVQKAFVSKVSAILTKIRAEERLLYLYHNCKQYLLSQMFI